MRTGQHAMSRVKFPRDSGRRRSPENKRRRPPFVDRFQQSLGKLLPALSAMGIGGVCTDGENSIEQQDTLSGPVLQPQHWNIFKLQVLLQFALNIAKRRRHWLRWIDGKRQSVGLMVVVIGILSKNHCTDKVEWRQLQSAENG